MSLREYLDPACVAVGLDCADKDEAIRALVGLLGAAGYAERPEELLAALRERELLAPTGLGEGCAIPHARSRAAGPTRIAGASLASPLDFGAPDGKPVSLVFLLVGPEGETGLHLKLLSTLARLLHDPSLRRRLLEARDPAAFAAALHSRGEAL